ncbi:MAG: rhomboid family intramembrane serine protease, partial [Actinomycetota bacterium]
MRRNSRAPSSRATRRARPSFARPSPTPTSTEPHARGPTSVGPLSAGSQPWRMFTAMFLHIGLIHIFFNMWALWNLGPAAE